MSAALPLPIRLADSVLVLVDYQHRLMPQIDRGEAVVAEALRLAAIARVLGVPVLGTEQNPDRLGPNGDAVRAVCGTTLAKTHFDACQDGLLALIATAHPPRPAAEPRDIVIAGCEAHVCLLQTTLGLLRAGHRARVVASACGSRRTGDHGLAMQRLQQAGATLVSLEMVAFEWLHDCRHPRFREVLQLVKAAPL